mmetsp:Transcript_5519/g.18266  ORF Transcript_5519/g.18266 Transcript_5519/m.18266 type:complete len:261 (+) Transcript_5519:258-1040(+)
MSRSSVCPCSATRPGFLPVALLRPQVMGAHLAHETYAPCGRTSKRESRTNAQHQLRLLWAARAPERFSLFSCIGRQSPMYPVLCSTVLCSDSDAPAARRVGELLQQLISSGHSRTTSSISRTSLSFPGTQNNSKPNTSSYAAPAAASSSSAARIAFTSPANDLLISSSRSPMRHAIMHKTTTVGWDLRPPNTPAALSAASTVALVSRSSNLAASRIVCRSKSASASSSSPLYFALPQQETHSFCRRSSINAASEQRSEIP